MRAPALHLACNRWTGTLSIEWVALALDAHSRSETARTGYSPNGDLMHHVTLEIFTEVSLLHIAALPQKLWKKVSENLGAARTYCLYLCLVLSWIGACPKAAVEQRVFALCQTYDNVVMVWS